MKLLTHNMLMSPGTRNGFPLAIEVSEMETVETEFNADFVARMVEKLEYQALLDTVASVRTAPPATAASPPAASDPVRARPQLKLDEEVALPAQVPASFAEDEAFLRALHHVLLEVEILEGTLVCPETAKRFPIKEGIPSML